MVRIHSVVPIKKPRPHGWVFLLVDGPETLIHHDEFALGFYTSDIDTDDDGCYDGYGVAKILILKTQILANVYL